MVSELTVRQHDEAPAPSSRRLPIWFSTKWFAAAMALILLAGVWAARSSVSSRPLTGNQIAEFAVATHRQHVQGILPLDMRTDSQWALNEWFKTKLPFALSLPASAPAPSEQRPYSLEGARLVSVGGKTAAFVAYRILGAADALGLREPDGYPRFSGRRDRRSRGQVRESELPLLESGWLQGRHVVVARFDLQLGVARRRHDPALLHGLSLGDGRPRPESYVDTAADTSGFCRASLAINTPMSKQFLNAVQIVTAGSSENETGRACTGRASPLWPAVHQLQTVLLGGSPGLSYLRLRRACFGCGVMQRSGVQPSLTSTKSKMLMDIVLTNEATDTRQATDANGQSRSWGDALRVEAVTASSLRV